MAAVRRSAGTLAPTWRLPPPAGGLECARRRHHGARRPTGDTELARTKSDSRQQPAAGARAAAVGRPRRSCGAGAAIVPVDEAARLALAEGKRRLAGGEPGGGGPPRAF